VYIDFWGEEPWIGKAERTYVTRWPTSMARSPKTRVAKFVTEIMFDGRMIRREDGAF
jgi:hypothetical protein